MENSKNIKSSLIGSCRLTICLSASFTYFAAVSQTSNLSMAIVCLNQQSTLRKETEDLSEFNAFGKSKNATEERELCFDKPTQGMLLGALYYGIVPVTILIGWICDKYRINKILMCIGSLLLAIASLLTPFVLEYGGIPYYFVLRIVNGVTLSFALSSIVPLLAYWTTATEQGFMMGISSAGMNVANSAIYPISGFLCRCSGWKSISYFGGMCGLMSTLLIFFFVYDNPKKHPRIRDEEKRYLQANQLQSKLPNAKSKVVPWSKMLLSIPVWAIVITNFFFFAVTKGTVLFLPMLLKDILGFTVTESGVFSAIPSVGALLIHVIAGPMVDYARSRCPSSITTIRKIFHALGTIVPAGLMFACIQLPPEYKYRIISMITVGFSLSEFASVGGFGYALVDIAPNFVGILQQGLNKTIGLASGFIIPSIIATLTLNGTREEWDHVFLLLCGLYGVSGLIFTIFGTSKLQKWNVTEEDSTSKEKIN